MLMPTLPTPPTLCSEFIWDGCRDYAPLLAISAALRALRQLGPEAVLAHQRRLLAAAVDCLVATWGTGVQAVGPVWLRQPKESMHCSLWCTLLTWIGLGPFILSCQLQAP